MLKGWRLNPEFVRLRREVDRERAERRMDRAKAAADVYYFTKRMEWDAALMNKKPGALLKAG